jgi:hypothetical protein
MSFSSLIGNSEEVKKGDQEEITWNANKRAWGISGHDDEQGVSPNATTDADNRMTVRIESRRWVGTIPMLSRMAMPCNIIFVDRIHANVMALLLHWY